VARAYGVSQGWVSRLVARYLGEGEAAFEPRSRRPKTSPSAISPEVAGLIVQLRKELSGQGLDAGPHTIAWHLEHHHQIRVSPATISRYLSRAGLVVPEPAKRPKSSYLRFEAELPNECWQSDFTHYPLADGTDAEILTWLDDHSRYALSMTAHPWVTGPIVLAAFRAAPDRYGVPASTLTDNGMVLFTTRLSGGRGGRNGLEAELRRRGVKQKNGKPNHPQTQGKVERFQQTLKKWLRAQPVQPATTGELQALPGHLRHHLQPAPPAPVPAAPGHPRHHLRSPAQSHPRRPVRRHPPPRPHRPHQRQRRRHHPHRRQALPHRHRAAPRRNPHPAAHPGPAHPASSTPPPANSCANSSSTPPATTRPPEHPEDAPADPGSRPPNVGSESFRCLETSHGWSG
jgi:transposase InsO family protein